MHSQEQQDLDGAPFHVQEHGGAASAGRVGYDCKNDVLFLFLPGITRVLVPVNRWGDSKGHRAPAT
jgi:hypothetical protein